ncbi:hypothetical protein PR048_021109 [Dryococelus australis]|uniref:Uncharacterized protein n=1 Tax=Dryococelus australis TaxID=614101 RepID=A0ABQ9GXB0_9NEOP|nr:hypothetical protein PR048_021109 [Dryococelus australis]
MYCKRGYSVLPTECISKCSSCTTQCSR